MEDKTVLALFYHPYLQTHVPPPRPDVADTPLPIPSPSVIDADDIVSKFTIVGNNNSTVSFVSHVAPQGQGGGLGVGGATPSDSKFFTPQEASPNPSFMSLASPISEHSQSDKASLLSAYMHTEQQQATVIEALTACLQDFDIEEENFIEGIERAATPVGQMPRTRIDVTSRFAELLDVLVPQAQHILRLHNRSCGQIIEDNENEIDALANFNKQQFLSQTGSFFWVYRGGYLPISICAAFVYMCAPCHHNMNPLVFIWVNRLIYATIAFTGMVVMTRLFTPHTLQHWTEYAIIVCAIIIDVMLDFTKNYFLSSYAWYAEGVTVLNVVNWMLCPILFFIWNRRYHPTVPLCSAGLGFFFLTLVTLTHLTVLEFLAVQVSENIQSVIPEFFIVFMIVSMVCTFITQQLCHVIVFQIAKHENRNVEWRDLVNVQFYLFFSYSTQYAFYRLLFVSLRDWELEALLIVLHVTQEVIMYPIRMLPRVRRIENMFRTRILGIPTIPRYIWLDLHCVDYMLRKIAEMSTLVLFMLRLVWFRNIEYVKECYSVSSYSNTQYIDLLIVSGVVFCVELLVGFIVVHFILYKMIQRQFLVHSMMTSGVHRRVLLGVFIVWVNCSATFSDAMKGVTFEK